MAARRILLVDDSTTVLLMERMLLRDQGYDLTTARNGKEAVEKARAEKPDLILMDVVMPEMDGFSALQALRKDENTREIPVIMVTTRSEAPNVQLGIESGCSDYVLKPINGLELVNKVKSHLR